MVFPGIISLVVTVFMGLLFSLRPGPNSECAGDEDAAAAAVADGADEAESGDAAAAAAAAITAELRLKVPRTMLDDRLLHPLARRLCCKSCRERKVHKDERANIGSVSSRAKILKAEMSNFSNLSYPVCSKFLSPRDQFRVAFGPKFSSKLLRKPQNLRQENAY